MSTPLTLPSHRAAASPAENPNGRSRPAGPVRILVSGAFLIGLWYALYRMAGPLAEFLTYDLLGLSRKTPTASAIAFFLYEVPKVLLLLVLVVFLMGVVRSFFSPARTRRLLSGRREVTGNVLASLLGVVTPFCSCSAVPLFIGFVTAGIPLGVTFSFLISAPMVNEVALALLFGLFGWKVALLYAGTGIVIALVSGWVIGRLKLESWVEAWVYEVPASTGAEESQTGGWAARIRAGRDAVREIVGKVWPYVVAGIAAGAGIHGWIPENFMASIMGRGVWWSVPLAVLIGVPMYSSAAGVIPVVEALLGKGAALGTVLAFMMSVIGLSLPEMVILRKVLSVRLIAVFAGIVALGILVVGYVFNLVL